jgi:hypothetical protein
MSQSKEARKFFARSDTCVQLKHLEWLSHSHRLEHSSGGLCEAGRIPVSSHPGYAFGGAV